MKGNKMYKLVSFARKGVVKFARDEEGAQVVEYALIIAVVSIALVVALQALGGGSFTTFIARVTTCLTTSSCV
jgi:pilus assembly protein Flp/PilA